MKLRIYQLRLRKKMQVLFAAFILFVGDSRTTIRIGLHLIRNGFDGRALLKKEGEVKKALEAINLSSEKYTMAAYTRRAFTPEFERTKSLYHSFYTVRDDDGFLFTLSFCGTRIKTKSKGVWATDTEADMQSYLSYKNGINEWEVREIAVNNGINTEKTIKNILNRMDKDIIYYYKDHINNKDGMENCNSALLNTLAEND
jgi:hypothetical protein